MQGRNPPARSVALIATLTATMSCRHKGIEFDALSAVPSAQRNSQTAALVPSVEAYLASGDSVRVSGRTAGDTFVGRIIDVSGYVPRDDSKHPRSSSEYRGQYVQVQLYLTKDDSDDVVEWDVSTNEGIAGTTWHDCLRMTEACPTNCTVWVPVDLIEGIVFFIHHRDCENQLFGCCVGRQDTYFVRRIARCTDETFQLGEDVEHNKYTPFGPQSSNTVLYTERCLRTIANELRKNKSLLISNGKIGVPHTQKSIVERDMFEFIRRGVKRDPAFDNVEDIQRKRTKQTITRADLSLESTRLSTTQTTINAVHTGQFDVLQRMFGCVMGVGVRKRHPKVDDNEPCNLRQEDTINMVNVNYTGVEASDADDWFNPDAELSAQEMMANGFNFIRFRYDSRTNELFTSMRTSALLAGSCQATELQDWLSRYDIDWDVVRDDEVFNGMLVNIEDEYWQVAAFNDGEATLRRLIPGDNDNEQRVETIQFCLDNRGDL